LTLLTGFASIIKHFFYIYLPIESKKDRINGLVIEALPGTTFKVELENGKEVLAYLAGKMRLHYIKVMPGDKVALEMSPDGSRGRIVYRY